MNNLIGFAIGFTLTLAAFWAMTPEPEEQDIPSYVPGTITLEGSARR
jgi:hypothetical protein